jgi:CheY-like chemotaxis protein
MGRSGTGLGMSVVWGAVKDHNGYIEVASREGEGTTFTLYFPASRKSISEQIADLDIDEVMGECEKILVVDDVPEQRIIAASMLEKLNYCVTSVASGEEAVAAVQQSVFDLLLIDMIMEPGMDGLDTYRATLKVRPSQKAIIASGFSETNRIRQMMALGAGAYIKKPYSMRLLAITVKKHLKSET